MKPTARPMALHTFDRLRRRKDWRTYCGLTPFSNHAQRWVAIHGLPTRLFVVVTDGHLRRIGQLRPSGETSAEGLSVPDMNNAFTLAHQLARKWSPGESGET